MLRKTSSKHPEKAVPFIEVILGALPFFLFGLDMILLELPLEWPPPAWFRSVKSAIFFILMVLPAVVFAAGWVQHFPRWTYPYTSMGFIMALYIQGASTPGLQLFGMPIFGRELWGWRAWVPLGLAFVIALALSRSLKPYIRFLSNLWQDWSLASYWMTGLLPLFVMASFDEIDRRFSLYFMVAFAVLLVGMAGLYLIARHPWQRVGVLTAAILVIFIATGLGTNAYWLENGGTTLQSARQTMWIMSLMALFMLSPAWLELLRRSMRRQRAV